MGAGFPGERPLALGTPRLPDERPVGPLLERGGSGLKAGWLIFWHPDIVFAANCHLLGRRVTPEAAKCRLLGSRRTSEAAKCRLLHSRRTSGAAKCRLWGSRRTSEAAKCRLLRSRRTSGAAKCHLLRSRATSGAARDHIFQKTTVSVPIPCPRAVRRCETGGPPTGT